MTEAERFENYVEHVGGYELLSPYEGMARKFGCGILAAKCWRYELSTFWAEAGAVVITLTRRKKSKTPSVNLGILNW